MKNDNKNLLLGISVAAAVIFVFGGFSMMGFGNYGYGGMMGNYGFSGMWIFGWLFMTLIFVALILFIVWLFQQIQNPRRKNNG